MYPFARPPHPLHCVLTILLYGRPLSKKSSTASQPKHNATSCLQIMTFEHWLFTQKGAYNNKQNQKATNSLKNHSPKSAIIKFSNREDIIATESQNNHDSPTFNFIFKSQSGDGKQDICDWRLRTTSFLLLFDNFKTMMLKKAKK